MRTEPGERTGRRSLARAARGARVLALAALLAAGLAPLGVPAAEEAGDRYGADWESWRADTTVADTASVQRGARYFVSYCLGCHSLKYERWSRLGERSRHPAGRARQSAAASGRQAGRLHHQRDARRRCRGLVRQGPAGSVADGPRPRQGLPVPLPDDLLRRPEQPDRRQQPGAALAVAMPACAVGARGAQERRLPPGRAAGRERHGDPRAGVRSFRDHRARAG